MCVCARVAFLFQHRPKHTHTHAHAQKKHSKLQKKGYATYVTVFYVIAACVLATLLLTAWVAVMLRKDDTASGPALKA